METKAKIIWKEEDNAYLNKVFKMMDLILAFCIILSPLITSAFCLCGVEIDVPNVLIMCYGFYIFIRIFSFIMNWRFIKLRKLDVVEILGIALFIMLCVTEFINSPVSFTIVLTFGYFVVFNTFITQLLYPRLSTSCTLYRCTRWYQRG